MAMSPLAFTLTGFERVAGVEHARSWLVSNFGRAESGRFCLARVVRQRYSAMVRVRPGAVIAHRPLQRSLTGNAQPPRLTVSPSRQPVIRCSTAPFVTLRRPA